MEFGLYHGLLLFTCYGEYDHGQENFENNVYHVQTRVEV